MMPPHGRNKAGPGQTQDGYGAYGLVPEAARDATGDEGRIGRGHASFGAFRLPAFRFSQVLGVSAFGERRGSGREGTGLGQTVAPGERVGHLGDAAAQLGRVVAPPRGQGGLGRLQLRA